MGKPTICIGENKGADQLRSNCESASQYRSNCEADLISAFVFATQIVQFLFYFNPKFQALFCACTGRFVSDLFGNHIVGFPTRRLMCYFIPDKHSAFPCRVHLKKTYWFGYGKCVLFYIVLYIFLYQYNV